MHSQVVRYHRISVESRLPSWGKACSLAYRWVTRIAVECLVLVVVLFTAVLMTLMLGL